MMLLDFAVFLVIARAYKYVKVTGRPASVDEASDSMPPLEVDYTYHSETEALLPKAVKREKSKVENDYSFS